MQYALIFYDVHPILALMTVIPPSGMMSSWEVMAFFPSLAKNFSPRLVLTLIIRA